MTVDKMKNDLSHAPAIKQAMNVFLYSHGVADHLVILIGGVQESVREAASEGSRALIVDWLQTHRSLHLPWSCVGAG